MVHFPDSLYNPSDPLRRLLAVRQQVAELATSQVSTGVCEAVTQADADDPPSVRADVRENRKLSPDEIVDLVRQYQVGATIRSVAQQFGLHEQTVRAHLRRQGMALRPLRALTDAATAELVRLYVDKTWTMLELARKFRISESAVRKALIRECIPRRAQARRPSVTRPTIRDW